MSKITLSALCKNCGRHIIFGEKYGKDRWFHERPRLVLDMTYWVSCAIPGVPSLAEPPEVSA